MDANITVPPKAGHVRGVNGRNRFWATNLNLFDAILVMEYEKMLERAYMLLPKEALNKERFELPELESHIQGTKTVIKNFSGVVKKIKGAEKDLIKFLTNELAVPITFNEGQLLISGKFLSTQLNKVFQNYLGQYVLCHECKKPDTKIIDMHGVKVLKCDACGATHPVKRL